MDAFAIVRVVFIINPQAGHGKGRVLKPALLHWAREAGIDADAWVTDAPGHGTELATNASVLGYDAALAVGGDGTAREVGMGLMGTQTALGIIPLGSGNGLARHLGLPLEPRRAVEAVPKLLRSLIDVGSVNGRPFLMAFGIGFDAAVAERFAAGTKRGALEYGKAILTELRTRQSIMFEMEINGLKQSGSFLSLTVANAREYGNNAIISPTASLHDGSLGLALVSNAPDWRLYTCLAGLLSGNLWRSGLVKSHIVSHMSVQTKDLQPYHVDGEFAGRTDTFVITLIPKSVIVLHECPWI